jgi:hypothetical protein
MTGIDPQSKFSDAYHRYFSSGDLVRKQPELASEGLASVALEMLFRDVVLAKGTGFFWRLSSGIALVTAWHNFTGLHHTLRTPISAGGGMPDSVRVRYTAKTPQQFKGQTFPLYLDADLDEPRWFVHRDCGSFFDIASLRLTLEKHDVFCANDVQLEGSEHALPGSDLFAIGYPQGVSTIGVIPIWKRGTLASEIDLPTEGHPKFLIDIAGRGGLSGAPVYRVQRGLISEGSGENRQFGFGNKTEFMGLYSGRTADQLPPDQRGRESSDLGFVWRSEIVVAAVACGVPDEKPEVGKGKVEFEPFWDDLDAPN